MVVAPQNLPPFAAYTDDDAWQFFLGPDGAGGADWEFMVEGHSLPVHSAVLAPQSRVLTDVLEEWQAAGCRPAPRATSNAHLLDHSTQLQVRVWGGDGWAAAARGVSRRLPPLRRLPLTPSLHALTMNTYLIFSPCLVPLPCRRW